MLPMILGFLGSAFAPAIGSALGLASLTPLVAGAVGQGLGTAIEQKDLGAGLRAGLGSFAGGKLLGGLMGSTAGGALQQPLPGQSTIGAGASAMTTGTPLSAAGGINSLMPPVSAAKPGLFGSGQLGTGIRRGMDFMGSAQGVGSAIGSALTAPTPTVKLAEQDMSEGAKNAAIEMKPIPRRQLTPPAGYRPGIDPEFNYGLGTPYSYGDILAYRDKGVLPYAEYAVHCEGPVNPPGPDLWTLIRACRRTPFG